MTYKIINKEQDENHIFTEVEYDSNDIITTVRLGHRLSDVESKDDIIKVIEDYGNNLDKQYDEAKKQTDILDSL